MFGGQDSHLPFATHANILSRIQSIIPHGNNFCPYTMLLYQFIEFLSFGSKFQPRLSSAQGHSTSELLRTL